MSRLIFVTGTDTEVGKTHVAALLAADLHSRGRAVGVYKPVASGCETFGGKLVSGDAVALYEAAGRPLDLDCVCPQRFEAPVSPPRSAQREGRRVDTDQLINGLQIWQQNYGLVIVEGAGGLCSPLADGMLNIDFAREIGGETLIVAANRLGVINHTLLTVDAIRNRLGREPIMIALNDVSSGGELSAASNQSELERYLPATPIHRVTFGSTSLPTSMLTQIVEGSE